MGLYLDIEGFRQSLAAFEPRSEALRRCLAFYSAAVAVADENLLSLAVRRGRRHDVTAEQFYEVVLQSHLFLGFPRMLHAAAHLNSVMPRPVLRESVPPTDTELHTWKENGLALCRRVYGEAFGPLKAHVESVAPEIFDWMIVEGYGKVLSRPGLDIVSRELAIVAFLMVENRPRQLFSHIRGALNVGATKTLLRTVVDDIGSSVGAGYPEAQRILEQLGSG